MDNDTVFALSNEAPATIIRLSSALKVLHDVKIMRNKNSHSCSFFKALFKAWLERQICIQAENDHQPRHLWKRSLFAPGLGWV